MWILRCLLDHFHSIVRGFEPSAICRIWLKGQTTRKLWKKDCAFGDAIGHCRWGHHPGNIHLHFWTFWITPLFHQSLRTRNSGCYQWSPTGLTLVAEPTGSSYLEARKAGEDSELVSNGDTKWNLLIRGEINRTVGAVTQFWPHNRWHTWVQSESKVSAWGFS